MVTISSGGKNFVFNSFRMKESFDLLCTEYHLESSVVLPFDAIVNMNGEEVDLIAVGFEYSVKSNGYRVKYIPKKVYNLITGPTLTPIYGEYSFEEVLTKYGVELVDDFTSDSTLWALRRQTFLNFFYSAKDYIAPAKGYLYTFNGKGNLKIINLTDIFADASNAKVFYGNVISNAFNIEQNFKTPSRVKQILYLLEKDTEREKVLDFKVSNKQADNYAQAVRPDITFYDNDQRVIENSFLRNYFTSYSCRVDDFLAKGIFLGDLYKEPESNNVGFIYSIDVTGDKVSVYLVNAA